MEKIKRKTERDTVFVHPLWWFNPPQ